jgi:hypothetical protein
MILRLERQRSPRKKAAQSPIPSTSLQYPRRLCPEAPSQQPQFYARSAPWASRLATAKTTRTAAAMILSTLYLASKFV